MCSAWTAGRRPASTHLPPSGPPHTLWLAALRARPQSVGGVPPPGLGIIRGGEPPQARRVLRGSPFSRPATKCGGTSMAPSNDGCPCVRRRLAGRRPGPSEVRPHGYLPGPTRHAIVMRSRVPHARAAIISAARPAAEMIAALATRTGACDASLCRNAARTGWKAGFSPSSSFGGLDHPSQVGLVPWPSSMQDSSRGRACACPIGGRTSSGLCSSLPGTKLTRPHVLPLGGPAPTPLDLASPRRGPTSTGFVLPALRSPFSRRVRKRRGGATQLTPGGYSPAPQSRPRSRGRALADRA